jgi:SNF2 family DNA or RNA helicase
VDEAHNIRNPNSKKSISLVKAAIKADKRLMLTATPFVNHITDFIPLINMVYGRMIVGTKKELFDGKVEEMLGKDINDTNLGTFSYLLQDKVDLVDCKDSKHFPERIDHYVDVEMSDKYYRDYTDLVYGINLYNILFENAAAFYNGYRRAVNGTGAEYYSSKVEAALSILQKGHCIIYTNWIDFGIRPITEALSMHNISFQTFTGSIPKEKRQGIIDSFNKNEFDVLILTKAGGEGIDLKGVRSVVVLDPTWNDAGLQQVIGRAIRYNSHIHLPLSKRKVDVYLMSLVPPSHISESVPSGDKILYNIIDKKKEIATTLLALLGELSI